MLLRIEKAKGQKDRYALLPPILLERLRTWWRYARAAGKVLPGAGICSRVSIRWIR
jgi:integrase/recombinase XerD